MGRWSWGGVVLWAAWRRVKARPRPPVRGCLQSRGMRWPGRQWASENRVMEHLSHRRLEAGLGQIRDSPRDGGRVVLVVSRPAVGMRELPGAALLDPVTGLAGD